MTLAEDRPRFGRDRVTATASVVICAYTEQRWPDLVAACRSLARQSVPLDEVVLVVDHNQALLDRARSELGVEYLGLRVVPNTGPRGLSGARNTGVEATGGEVVLFLDDDAEPAPEWAERLLAPFADPDVIGAGGWAEPRWDGGRAPSWMPTEFLWTVGCSYRGMPPGGARIRNPIGASMAFRRQAFGLVAGFSTEVGRIGTRPVGCEETEFAIRVAQARPRARIVQVTDSVVWHRVPVARQSPRYFLSRCFHEGRSKRRVSALVGSGDGLSSERAYVTRVLPSGVLAGLVATVRTCRPGGLGRAVAIVAGLAATAVGYLLPSREGTR